MPGTMLAHALPYSVLINNTGGGRAVPENTWASQDPFHGHICSSKCFLYLIFSSTHFSNCAWSVWKIYQTTLGSNSSLVPSAYDKQEFAPGTPKHTAVSAWCCRQEAEQAGEGSCRLVANSVYLQCYCKLRFFYVASWIVFHSSFFKWKMMHSAFISK
jgi:hypothetical protein